jgi:hypothetical protein
LDEVLDIAQYNTISFRITLSLRSKRLDLHTLAYWHRKLFFKSGRIVEDSAEGVRKAKLTRASDLL